MTEIGPVEPASTDVGTADGAVPETEGRIETDEVVCKLVEEDRGEAASLDGGFEGLDVPLVVLTEVVPEESLKGLLDVLLKASLEMEVEEVTELAGESMVLDEGLSVVLDEVIDVVVVSGDDTKPEATELDPSLASGDVVDSVVVVESPLEELIRLLNKDSNEDCKSLLLRDDFDEPNDVVESSEDDEEGDDEADKDEDSILGSGDGITGC